MKTYTECTDTEVLNFLNLYFATLDVLYQVQKRYDALSTESITLWERGKYRALSLDTLRDIELMKHQRRHFMDNQLGIAPPSAEMVAHAKSLCQQLAQANAIALTGPVMVTMAELAMDSFVRVVHA